MVAASATVPMESPAITATTTPDAAIATVYGWDADIEEDDPLRELLALNIGVRIKGRLNRVK